MEKRRALNKPAMARGDRSNNDSDNNNGDSDDNFENLVTELLEERGCPSLKQAMLDSLLQVARHSSLSIHEKATEWQKQWMTQYGDQLPISLDQAFELCNLASIDVSTTNSRENELMVTNNDRKVGDDIRVLLPIPSGCFGEDMCETTVPVPLPTTVVMGSSASSWYPPLATCEDPMSEEDEDVGEYIDDVYDSEDDDDGPINM